MYKKINLNKQIFLLCVLVLAIVFTASCLVPEKFNAKIKVNKNGAYSFVYDGILTFVDASAAAISGELSAKDEREIKQLEKLISSDKNFKEVKYLGKGRFKVLYKKEGDTKSSLNFMDGVIRIIPTKDKKIEIRGIKLDEMTIQQFQQLGMKFDGKLDVTTDAKVVKHNATSTPWFGIFGSYGWKIKSAADPAPEMTIQVQ